MTEKPQEPAKATEPVGVESHVLEILQSTSQSAVKLPGVRSISFTVDWDVPEEQLRQRSIGLVILSPNHENISTLIRAMRRLMDQADSLSQQLLTKSETVKDGEVERSRDGEPVQ